MNAWMSGYSDIHKYKYLDIENINQRLSNEPDRLG